MNGENNSDLHRQAALADKIMRDLKDDQSVLYTLVRHFEIGVPTSIVRNYSSTTEETRRRMNNELIGASVFLNALEIFINQGEMAKKSLNEAEGE